MHDPDSTDAADATTSDHRHATVDGCETVMDSETEAHAHPNCGIAKFG